MKITKIEAQVKTLGRYSVFVDDKFAFGLSELALIESGIQKGQGITESELEAFKEESDIDKIYGRTLGLLARRPRSSWELRDYLKRKEQTTDRIEKILNKLSINGYVNDEDFARRWVESRRLLKSTSKRKLQVELKQKRIPDEIIQRVLADDETNEQDVLRDLIAKKRTQTRYQDKTKLMMYLSRQGYNYDDIKQVLSED